MAMPDAAMPERLEPAETKIRPGPGGRINVAWQSGNPANPGEKQQRQMRNARQ